MKAEPLTRDALITAINGGAHHDFLFFWGHTGKKDVPASMCSASGGPVSSRSEHTPTQPLNTG